jgi:GTP-binding protein
MRIPREWERMEEESVDQLSDDEIDRQWEYNVADPTNPQLTDTQPDDGNSHA